MEDEGSSSHSDQISVPVLLVFCTELNREVSEDET